MRLRVLFPLSLRFRQYRVNSCKHSFPCKVILRFTLCCTCGTEAVKFAVDQYQLHISPISRRQLRRPPSASLRSFFAHFVSIHHRRINTRDFISTILGVRLLPLIIGVLVFTP